MGVIGRAAFILTLCACRALLCSGDETTTGRLHAATNWEAHKAIKVRIRRAWPLRKHATHAHMAAPVRKRAHPSGENGVAAYRRWGVGITGKSVRETRWGLARQRRSLRRQTYRVSAGGASRYRSAGFLAARRASSGATRHDSARWRSGVDEAVGAVVVAAHRSQERSPGQPGLTEGAAVAISPALP